MKRIMHPILYLIILLFCTLSTAATHFAVYEVEMEVVDETVLSKVSLELEEELSSLKLELPKDSEAIAVKGKNFTFNDGVLNIEGDAFRSLEFEYQSSFYIERRDDNIFVYNIEGLEYELLKIKLTLPEGAFLIHPVDDPRLPIIPKPSNIDTDGKRMLIEWDEKSFAEGEAIIVRYESRTNLMFFFIIAAGLIIFIIAILFYVSKFFKHKALEPIKEEITRNLFEEEKRIVDILLENENEMWQKQLENKSGLPKVKLSRKIRSLEEKGVIDKIPYGNSNKIRLKKL